MADRTDLNTIVDCDREEARWSEHGFYIPGVRHIAAAGEGDRDETQQAFDRYLQLWADNEHRGCHGVFLSEHHFLGLSLAPSPHLLIAALSQRTSRLRLGVMSSALPLHDVRRLVEECGMLDYLSHGRLEIGIGPGVGAIEAGLAGMDAQDVRPRYASGADLLDKYLVAGTGFEPATSGL